MSLEGKSEPEDREDKMKEEAIDGLAGERTARPPMEGLSPGDREEAMDGLAGERTARPPMEGLTPQGMKEHVQIKKKFKGNEESKMEEGTGGVVNVIDDSSTDVMIDDSSTDVMIDSKSQNHAGSIPATATNPDSPTKSKSQNQAGSILATATNPNTPATATNQNTATKSKPQNHAGSILATAPTSATPATATNPILNPPFITKLAGTENIFLKACGTTKKKGESSFLHSSITPKGGPKESTAQGPTGLNCRLFYFDDEWLSVGDGLAVVKEGHFLFIRDSLKTVILNFPFEKGNFKEAEGFVHFTAKGRKSGEVAFEVVDRIYRLEFKEGSDTFNELIRR